MPCLRSAAASLAAVDFAAEQGAGRCAENRAGAAVTSAVDRPAEQRAAGGADDEPGRAVVALAVIAAVVAQPLCSVPGVNANESPSTARLLGTPVW